MYCKQLPTHSKFLQKKTTDSREQYIFISQLVRFCTESSELLLFSSAWGFLDKPPPTIIKPICLRSQSREQSMIGGAFNKVTREIWRRERGEERHIWKRGEKGEGPEGKKMERKKSAWDFQKKTKDTSISPRPVSKKKMESTQRLNLAREEETIGKK